MMIFLRTTKTWLWSKHPWSNEWLKRMSFSEMRRMHLDEEMRRSYDGF